MRRTTKSARRHSVRLCLLTAVGASLLLIAACSGKTADAITVVTVQAKSGSVTKNVEFSGIFTPNQTVDVSSELGGQVTTVAASIGNVVKEGEVLVRIDTRRLQAQLAGAKAAEQSVKDQANQAKLGIQTAKANLDLAQKSYDRTAALYKTKAVSKKQMDDAQNSLYLDQSQYKKAKQQYDLLVGSSLSQAEARIDLINVQLGNGVVASPIAGVVTNRSVNPGETVGIGSPIMTIADTSVLKLQGTVSQDTVPLLALGQKVKILVDGMPGGDYVGTISQIGPVAASTGQYFPVVVTLKNDGRLLAGMTAIASFQITGPPSVVIPTSAVQRDGRTSYVYVVKDGAVTRLKVLVGLQNDSEIAVSSGLKAGDSVATDNIGLLQDGMAVTVAD